MKNFAVLPIVVILSSLFSANVLAQSMPPARVVEAPSLASAQIQNHFTLKEAAQAAVLKSPEVLARWHSFRESSEEAGVARGGFLPKLDYSVAGGRQKTEQKEVGTDLSYNRNDQTLTLRQMLFDGFATSSEVKRLGRAKLVRYYELLDASENVALEAGRAYLDVVRYRQHVALSEDNYIQHQAAYEQLKQRAASGVGKRVDVDQAASRLALADVNLTTAYANLHDVTARYVRIVGEQPGKALVAPTGWNNGFPGDAGAALTTAMKRNPALRASVENIEAAQYDLEGRRAAFMPKLDFVASTNKNSNYEDAGSRTDKIAELRLNFNLFNGGTDLARHRQYRERKDVALDLREKACRDMRQTLSIAYNDTLRLNDQMSHMRTQVALLEKTRAAYRDQFNIGQRSLLDLLNTQNEYFDARRTLANAEADLAISYMRSYASMGQLLENLGLKRIDAENGPNEKDLTPVDLAELCPLTTPAETTLDREALNLKVKNVIESTTGIVGGRPQPVIAAPSEPLKSAGPAASTVDTPLILNRLKAWEAAWAARDVKNYLGFYAAEFAPESGQSREAWGRQREQRLTKANAIRLEIQSPVVKLTGSDTATVEFRQIYSADNYSDTTDKVLEWRKQNGQWLIVGEKARATGAAVR